MTPKETASKRPRKEEPRPRVCILYFVRKANGVVVRVCAKVQKFGQVTDRKLNSIAENLNGETGLQIELDAAMIGRIYNVLSAVVNENNALAIFTRLGANIEALSLRMKLLLNQAAGSGLTSYMSTIQAVKIFVDFPWNLIFDLYRDELVNFRAALELVGNNQYYGFAHDLGAV